MPSTRPSATGSANMDNTHYVLGTACGPHPFPAMVAYFQSIIGQEAREQILAIEGTTSDPGLCLRGRRVQCPGGLQRFLMTPWNWSGWRQAERASNGPARLTPRHRRMRSVGVAQGYKTFFSRTGTVR